MHGPSLAVTAMGVCRHNLHHYLCLGDRPVHISCGRQRVQSDPCDSVALFADPRHCVRVRRLLKSRLTSLGLTGFRPYLGRHREIRNSPGVLVPSGHVERAELRYRTLVRPPAEENRRCETPNPCVVRRCPVEARERQVRSLTSRCAQSMRICAN